MKTHLLIGIFLLVNIGSLLAQDKKVNDSIPALESKSDFTHNVADVLKNFKVAGYFQGQYQHGQKDVKRMMVGGSNENYGEKSFNRIGLRRAFVSTMYEQGLVYALVTIEMKDNKEVWFSDAFINFTDPWSKRFQLALGSMNPEFGYELSISPSNYELVEGTAFLYSLMPDIYDIGAKLSYQAPDKYGYLRILGSMIAGNGVQRETDSRRDYIFTATASTNKQNSIRLSGGISYYTGSVYQGTENVYKMRDKKFVLDANDKNKGKYAKREYFDFNAQLAIDTKFGLSQLRGEYVIGTQPSAIDSYDSPNSADRPEVDTYIRKFNGGYIYYLQQIGPKLPLTFFGGYSWHNPNTKVSKDAIGITSNTNSTDIKYQTASLGLIWYPLPPVRIQAFYEMPINEKSVQLADVGYNRNRKDNVFTLRIQYKY